MRWTTILMLSVVLWLPAISRATDYPPANHAGGNVTLQTGDRIYGVHTNIGTLTIASGQNVTVLPYASATTGSGYVEINAATVDIAGTLNASGAGYAGGGGGGGGGGSAKAGLLGNAALGTHGNGGASIDGNAGSAAADGKIGEHEAGGDGGGGARGSGPYPGERYVYGVDFGLGSSGHAGGGGAPGGDGGYLDTWKNGDTSTDTSANMGSGGASGGGGAGGGTSDTLYTGEGSGGGGGGAAGGNGGGYIKIFATASMNITGSILTKGTLGAAGGNGVSGVYSTSYNNVGGDGGNGGSASATSGTGIGGSGGGGTYTGGKGGDGGKGAGGGLVLSCLVPGAMTLTGATLDARGGGNTTTNGGTIKLFYGGVLPTGATLTAGRTYSFNQNPDNTAPTYSGAAGVISAVKVAGHPEQVLVKWNAATDNTSAANQIVYEIYASLTQGTVFSGSPVSTATGGVTQAVVTGLPAGGARSYFGVRARDLSGNREMNTVTVQGPALTAVGKWTSYR